MTPAPPASKFSNLKVIGVAFFNVNHLVTTVCFLSLAPPLQYMEDDAKLAERYADSLTLMRGVADRKARLFAAAHAADRGEAVHGLTSGWHQVDPGLKVESNWLSTS